MRNVQSRSFAAPVFMAYPCQLPSQGNPAIAAWVPKEIAYSLKAEQLERLQMEYAYGLEIFRTKGAMKIVRPMAARSVRELQDACNLLARHLARHLGVLANIHSLRNMKELSEMER